MLENYLPRQNEIGVIYIMAMKKGNLSINSENIFPIIKKWLYSDHDIFFRELISNGCDAITKLKKLDMMGEYQLPDEYKAKIQVIVNPEKKTLKFIDNGLGMTADEVEEYINIKKWLKSKKCYTKRYALGLLNSFYLDDGFDVKYLDMAIIKSDEYYINMMIAWYFATALAKQWEEAVKWVEEGKLTKWVHNKSIQKAVESYRITAEQKEYLRTLKRR